MSFEIIKILDYDQDRAYCTLIRYRNLKIVLDCGLPASLDISKYQKSIDLLSNLDLLLISSAEIENSGALFYFINKLNCRENVYATEPTKKLLSINTILFMSKLIANIVNTDIAIRICKKLDYIILNIKEIKMRQKIKKYFKNIKVRFQAFAKGKSLGSCAFELKINGHSIAYLVEYSIKKELHINSELINFFLKRKVDLIISYLSQEVPNILKEDSFYENICKYILLEQKIIIYIDEVTRIFEYYIIVKKILKERKIFRKIIIPEIYDSQIVCMKNLTEYMSDNISKNFTLDDLYSLEDCIFLKEASMIKSYNSYIIICSSLDSLNEDVNEHNEDQRLVLKIKKLNGSDNFIKVDFDHLDKIIKEIDYLKDSSQNFQDENLVEKCPPKVVSQEADNQEIDRYFDFLGIERFFRFNFETEKREEYGEVIPWPHEKFIIEKEIPTSNMNNAICLIDNYDFYKNILKYFHSSNKSDLTKSHGKILVSNYLAFLPQQLTFLLQLSPQNILFLNSCNKNSNIGNLSIKCSYFNDQDRATYDLKSFNKKITLDILNEKEFTYINIDKKIQATFKEISLKPFRELISLQINEKRESQITVFKKDILMNLKFFLEDQGLTIKLRQGKLQILENVFIQKEENDLVIKGKLSQNFFKIRQYLYNFLHE